MAEAEAEAFRPAKRLKAALAPNIFAQFTALANQHKAANLGQGFPSFGSPDFLRKAVEDAMDGDVFAETGAPKALGNQYTRPGGEPTFAQTVARIYGPRFNRQLDPMKEIVTTIGAQEAIFTCFFSWTDPEDEVVLFTPCFDAVVKSASTLGVKLVGVNMKPPDSGATSSKAWTVNMDELETAITSKTRILMFNTPSAPLGKVFRKEELEAIAAVVKKHPPLLVISDEVYERCVYDKVSHFHFAALPDMFERTMTLFSVGKTFSCTGWRVGYIIAPAALAAPLLATHTAVNFCAPTPLQKASAAAFQKAEQEGYFEWMSTMMQEKRDKLVKVLQEIGLNPLVPEGGYFVICDASIFLAAANISISDTLRPETPLEERPDVKICRWMTEHVGVTAIPVSPFYLPESRHHANRLIRFALCKDEATMSLAAERLRQWHRRQRNE